MLEPKKLDDNAILHRQLDAALLEILPVLSGAEFSSEEEADAYAVNVVRAVRTSSGESD